MEPMKKWICIALFFSLCLSLCACGVKQEYRALVEQLEAENYAQAGEELLALSPELEEKYRELNEMAELYDKYSAIIDAMEAERYEEAAAQLQLRIPEPPKPESTEVIITIDNWAEYFEIREMPVADPFGRLEMYAFLFVPREEYVDRLDYSVDFSLDISHVDTYCGEYRYSFDAQTGEFFYLDAKFKSESSYTNVNKMTSGMLRSYAEHRDAIRYDELYAMIYCGAVFDDVVQMYRLEIDNIRGSVYILN